MSLRCEFFGFVFGVAFTPQNLAASFIYIFFFSGELLVTLVARRGQCWAAWGQVCGALVPEHLCVSGVEPQKHPHPAPGAWCPAVLAPKGVFAQTFGATRL